MGNQMNNIQMSDEDISFLSNISNKLKTQDNRFTRNPMFEVRDRVKVWGIDSDYETNGCSIISCDGDISLKTIFESDYETEEEAIAMLKEHEFSDEQIKEIMNFDDYNISNLENSDVYAIEQLIADMDYKIVYYRIDNTKIITYCYTEDAANQFISNNKHNMHDPFVYVNYLDDRNVEMNKIRDIITKYF